MCCCENFTFDRRREMSGMARMSADCLKNLISFGFAEPGFFEDRFACIPRPGIEICMATFIFAVAQVMQQSSAVCFLDACSVFVGQFFSLVGDPSGVITPHPFTHACCGRCVQLANFSQYYFVFFHLLMIAMFEIKRVVPNTDKCCEKSRHFTSVIELAGEMVRSPSF